MRPVMRKSEPTIWRPPSKLDILILKALLNQTSCFALSVGQSYNTIYCIYLHTQTYSEYIQYLNMVHPKHLSVLKVKRKVLHPLPRVRTCLVVVIHVQYSSTCMFVVIPAGICGAQTRVATCHRVLMAASLHAFWSDPSRAGFELTWKSRPIRRRNIWKS